MELINDKRRVKIMEI